MAPEGQEFWEQYEEQGMVYISVMVDSNAGGTPDQSTLQSWADSLGITHPVVNDETGNQGNYVVTGYPTFVVIDQTMTIQNDDLWPWDPSAVTSLLNQ